MDALNYFCKPTTAEYMLGIREPAGDSGDREETARELDGMNREARKIQRVAVAEENAYCTQYYRGRKRLHPSKVDPSFPEKALVPTGARVPEIEPPVVRKAWRTYRRRKLVYTAALVKTNPPAKSNERDDWE
jgi:hypothetical protein